MQSKQHSRLEVIRTHSSGDGLANDFIAGDSIMVLYDNGVDSFLAVAESGATVDNTTFASGDFTVTNVITFVGITDCTTIVGGSFQPLR